MCLIFLAVKHHPAYKLIVAGNRDEFYNRPTLPANFWTDDKHLLGGRDLEAGGTWLGVNTSGKISMLTNYRDPQHIDPKAPSRGQLVSDYLKEEGRPEDYLKHLAADAKKYNGFNLLVGDKQEMWYYSNYSTDIKKLEPGFYGISNHLLETPWPKVVRGKQKLALLLEQPVINPDDIFDALYDDMKAPHDQLPSTGLTEAREYALSSMFIKTENYGSRCSTIIAIDNHDKLFFSERVYNTNDFSYTTRSYNLGI